MAEPSTFDVPGVWRSLVSPNRRITDEELAVATAHALKPETDDKAIRLLCNLVALLPREGDRP